MSKFADIFCPLLNQTDTHKILHNNSKKDNKKICLKCRQIILHTKRENKRTIEDKTVSSKILKVHIQMSIQIRKLVNKLLREKWFKL